MLLTPRGLCDCIGMSNTQKPAALTAEEAQKQAHDALLGGTEPFNDGETPERIAARNQRVAEYMAKKNRQLTQQQERAALVARTPILRIAKAISEYQFWTQPTEAEIKRSYIFKRFDDVPRRDPAGNPMLDENKEPVMYNPGKEARKGFNVALMRYWRAQFYAGREMNVLCTRRLFDTVAVARIVDLARYIFWKYRKPGCLGIEISDADLNFSLQRVQSDFVSEEGLVGLLNQFRDDLLARGIFSEDPTKYLAPATRDRKKRYFQSTSLMAEMKALRAKVEEYTAPANLAPAVAKLDEDLKAAVSHYTTAHGVTINALNELQKKEEADAKAVVFLTNTVLRLLTRVEELERRPSPMFIPPAPILEPGYTPHYPAPGWETTCENKSESVAENPPSVQ